MCSVRPSNALHRLTPLRHHYGRDSLQRRQAGEGKAAQSCTVRNHLRYPATPFVSLVTSKTRVRVAALEGAHSPLGELRRASIPQPTLDAIARAVCHSAQAVAWIVTRYGSLSTKNRPGMLEVQRHWGVV